MRFAKRAKSEGHRICAKMRAAKEVADFIRKDLPNIEKLQAPNKR